jgi:hypothetical protein
MTILDYLLLGGALVAGGYLLTRLFIGWRVSTSDSRSLETSIVNERDRLS